MAKAATLAEDMTRTYMVGGADPSELENSFEKCPNCFEGWITLEPRDGYSTGKTMHQCRHCGGTSFVEKTVKLS
jgi:hypothetical protein